MPGDEPAPDRRGAAAIAALRGRDWVLPPGLARPGRRSWLRIGTLDGGPRTLVDPRGLICPCSHAHGASLDWWIGAQDRWHAPAREAGVRQRRVGDAPVVETRLRIPGGDAVQRVWAIRAAPGDGADEHVIVEVANETRVPFALALVLRPLTPARVARSTDVHVTALPGGSGSARRLDHCSEPFLLLPRPPGRWAVGRGGDDVFAAVTEGRAEIGEPLEGWLGEPAGDGGLGEPAGDGAVGELGGPAGDARFAGGLSDGTGLLTLALIFPVPHGTTLRAVLPRGVWPPERAEDLSWPTVVPDHQVVASGWTAQAQRGARLDVPDPLLAEALAAARRSLLLAPQSGAALGRAGRGPVHAGDALHAGDGWGPPASPPEVAVLAGALARAGRADAAERSLLAVADRWYHGEEPGRDPTSVGATLVALGTHTALTGDGRVLEPVLDRAVAWLRRWDRAARRGRFPAGTSPARWARDAAVAVAAALAALGQPDGAAGVRALAARLPPVVESVPDLDAPGVALRAVGAAARRLLARGDPRALDLIALMLRGASPVWAWPSVLDRSTGSGADEGEGDDAVVGALFVDVVRDLLAVEVDGGIDLVPVLPAGWWGQGWELHEAPTTAGSLSYAVRWHGERPALLWDLEPAPWSPPDPVVLRVPGLDAGWSTTDRRGEVLLAPVPVPSPPAGEVETGAAAVGADARPGGPRPEDRARSEAPRSVWRPQPPGRTAP
ncbi:MAG: hypothetical protein HYX34_13465 [Actinobacteria bacterium]|nr:hypothetical protein [Actinomycetota bacterium]